MVFNRLFNQAQETESHGKTDPARGTIQIPMTSFHNYEKLDYASLRKLCETDWRKHHDCIMCNEPQNIAHRCKGCGSARYCSWECEADDQPHHDLVCAQWANFQEPPSETAGRMLIFPAQSTTPVFAWADLIRHPDKKSPLLSIPHPEAHAFIDLFTGITRSSKLGRMGCINECRAIAHTKHPLGHGLFVLEFLPPPQTNIPTTWINQSIQSITNLPPGQTWLWTGPIAIIALDMTNTNAKTHQYTLSNITLRDVRHAIDFFTLNLRNAAIPPPLPTPRQATTTLPNRSSRFPFPPHSALKLNEPHIPLAKTLGITAPLEEVHVSRYLPRTARAYEGVSAVGAALGLAWVVRVVVGHGAELDWGYDGFFPGHTGFVAAAAGDGGGGGGGGALFGAVSGGGGCGSGWFECGSGSGSGSASSESEAASSEFSSSASDSTSSELGPGSDSEFATFEGENNTGNGSIIPTQLDLVFTLDEETGGVEGKRFPRTGDGLTLMHAGGQRLRKEHVQALIVFIKQGGVDEKYRFADEKLERDFQKFWKEFRTREKVPADVPSPYDLTPTLSGVKSGDKFLVCRHVFQQLIPRGRPDLRVLAGGLCVRR